VFTNLFKNANSEGLETKMVQQFRIEQENAKKIVFLLELSKMNVEDVLDIFRKRQQCAITDATILEWLEVSDNQNDMLVKFIDYKPTTSSQELMSQGFKGKELGEEIKRLEIDKFKQML
jgi:hypothetical protein